MAGPSSIVPQPTYGELINQIANAINPSDPQTGIQKIITDMNNLRLNPEDITDIAQYASDVLGMPLQPLYRVDRTLVGYAGVTAVDTPSSTTTALAVRDSNVSIQKTNVNTVMGTDIETDTSTGQRIVKFQQPTDRQGNPISGVWSAVKGAIGVAGAGAFLGKLISRQIYDTHPQWLADDELWAYDPENWDSVSLGIDGAAGWLWDTILGLDANGNTQMYIDENALAYAARYMNDFGVFDPVTTVTDEYPENMAGTAQLPLPIPYTSAIGKQFFRDTGDPLYRGDGWYVATYDSDVYVLNVVYSFNPTAGILSAIAPPIMFSLGPFTVKWWYRSSYANQPNKSASASRQTRNGKTFYVFTDGANGQGVSVDTFNNLPTYETLNYTSPPRIEIAYISLFGHATTSSTVPGVSDQPNATLPDTTNWDTPENTLESLQNQYPDAWNNAIDLPSIQPDGTVKTHTYVPVPMPNFNPDNQTQPWVEGDATQANPNVNPNSNPEIKEQVKEQLENPTDNSDPTKPTNPETNPSNTGDGETPVTTIPTGTASALYAIYNPTQAELNSFGGWLWSPNFVDQLLKMFNDPMQAIIGLHKVFATPVVSGRQNIQVGYLDSGVASNTVGAQYATIDCGSVSLTEYFGNVFDYSPYTQVDIFLPFIGIHKLDVADVMRSTIGVVYHVDVLTGACLAEINVNRDGGGGTLYTFSGNCAVQYPLSSGSYMGIISTVASVATSALAGFAGGGPVGAAMGGGMAAIHGSGATISKSGSLSGNSGAMGGKIPYLIISRPQTTLASTFPNQQGYPTNYSATLGEYTGFVQCRALHTDGIAATHDELAEIRRYLETGVIV